MQNLQPPSSYQGADKQPDRTARQLEQNGMLRRLADRWLHFAGPPGEMFGSSVQEQELRRRSRLLSALLFFGLVTILLAAPTAIPVPTYWIPLIFNLLFSMVALFLNRTGRVTIAGVFYILAIDATLIILMLTLPTGIRNSNIPDFDLFFLPVLISGIILPKRLIPVVAGMHIIIIITLFGLLPHDRLLTEEIRVNQQGFAYSELSDAIIIQVLGGAIAWLSAWSVDRALIRASRAEDLAEARQQLNEQASTILSQKQRLDYGIEVLKNAQARLANGDFSARARLQDNELVPLAMSFNLLAERLTRITQASQDYTRLEQALQQLLEMQNSIFYQGTINSYQPTGTIADRMLPVLQRYHHLNSMVSQSTTAVERLRVDSATEKRLVSELASVMGQLYRTGQAALPDSTNTGKFSSAPLSGSSSSGSLSSRDNRSNTSRSFHTEMRLIERAIQICNQLEQYHQHHIQNIKQLGQLLKKPIISSYEER